jgi:hypothetical protein
MQVEFMQVEFMQVEFMVSTLVDFTAAAFMLFAALPFTLFAARREWGAVTAPGAPNSAPPAPAVRTFRTA